MPVATAVIDCPGLRPLCGCFRGKSRLLGGYAVRCRECHENAAPIVPARQGLPPRFLRPRIPHLPACPAGGPICHREARFHLSRDACIPSSISHDAQSFAALRDQKWFAPVHLPSLRGRRSRIPLTSNVNRHSETPRTALAGAGFGHRQTLFDVGGGRPHEAVQHRGGMFGQTGEVENAFDAPGHRIADRCTRT